MDITSHKLDRSGSKPLFFYTTSDGQELPAARFLGRQEPAVYYSELMGEHAAILEHIPIRFEWAMPLLVRGKEGRIFWMPRGYFNKDAVDEYFIRLEKEDFQDGFRIIKSIGFERTKDGKEIPRIVTRDSVHGDSGNLLYYYKDSSDALAGAVCRYVERERERMRDEERKREQNHKEDITKLMCVSAFLFFIFAML